MKVQDFSDGGVIWWQRKRNWCRTRFSFTKYTLTDSELIVQSGVLRQRFETTPLFRIVDVTVERSLLQQVFGLCTIVVNAYDVSSGGVIRLVNVIDGFNVRRLIVRAVDAARSGVGVRPREYMSADGLQDYSDSDGVW